MGIMCAKAVVAPGKPFCMCQTEGGYNMGIVYVRDNESEIGIPRPPPVLGGKTLPSSGPSPISSSPQTQHCSAQPPFPFIPPPFCSQSPGLPASFPASSWWHLASQLLLRRSLFCRLSLTFIMYRHHERASVFLAECCLSIHTTVYLPISYGGTVGLSLAFGWRMAKS